MISNIQIQNFRGFYNHSLRFKKSCIIVGKNNAGKSTVVEALRLVSLITNKYRTSVYKKRPTWLDAPSGLIGVSPSIKNIGINFDTIFFHYGSSPSIITAEFNDKNRITIYVGDGGKIFAVLRNSRGTIVKTRSKALKLNLTPINIFPQVGPVQKKEMILNSDYVKSNIGSHLSSLHFRNQLYLFPELFQKFKEAVEETWPSVTVKELIATGELDEKQLSFQVRNENFVAEVAEMGHGLQVWLQIIWFLTRVSNNSTVILDEPDVYMHADLQRRLIRFLRNKYNQILITTHSTEIMAEVGPEDILVIDKEKPESTYANTFPIVQTLIEQIGSAQNIHMARLWNAKRLILVEGKDIKLLKIFQNSLFPNSDAPFDAIPNMSLGGWGGWNYAIGSSMLLKNSLNQNIFTYCIFDSDYHTAEEISTRLDQANDKGIFLHIWSKKEIENYLLIPSALQRVIENNLAKRTSSPSIDEIEQRLMTILSEMEESVLDAISSELLKQNRGWTAGKSNKEARKLICDSKAQEESIISIASGKYVIKKFADWSQQEFGVSLNAIAIAKEMTAQEIPNELIKIVTSIEKSAVFKE
ncbi:ATP-dependent endonuclease [Desulfobacter hydrogenophilus]|uniref:ATP-dependent endonuclease n=1 Tax=Desulfobacter hydrogenophilus TaxID=2291 RepID=A0A328FDY0_9BACT|nr:ATP-binding protein [Desulfobacter hydrogenophilus]NDY71358.1 ATP-binding protein [Desulfobacter hydrogenophilus]QBH12244.1 DUF2813 domain-containing protein [Desulfobacter hydrogenophilus]RAM01245.1 ATP-dependent endonuclease [Desulfobacter hydrogenophilus]